MRGFLNRFDGAGRFPFCREGGLQKIAAMMPRADKAIKPLYRRS